MNRRVLIFSSFLQNKYNIKYNASWIIRKMCMAVLNSLSEHLTSRLQKTLKTVCSDLETLANILIIIRTLKIHFLSHLSDL